MGAICTLWYWIEKNPALFGTAITIGLAVWGATWKYSKDIEMQQNKDRLERVNLQLRLLYGPLYAIFHASNSTWLKFRQTNRPGQPYFSKNSPPSQIEEATWRLWITEVFMPFNLKMEDTIVSNADLLIEDDFPESLRLLCIHVAAYKPILKLWEQNNFSNHLSLFNFPRKELHVYVEEGFKGLKHEQARLLGLLGESIS